MLRDWTIWYDGGRLLIPVCPVCRPAANISQDENHGKSKVLEDLEVRRFKYSQFTTLVKT